MALAAIDEAIRNAVCVGGDPNRMAILDNFCWPSVDDEKTMGTLVRACEACRDGALAYGVPFISGKDSLHNQFTNQETGQVIRIPNTLLISAIGVIDDVNGCVTMDFKHQASRVVLITPVDYQLATLARLHRAVASLLRDGLVLACHDISDGGLAAAIAEMCIGSDRGIVVPQSLLLNDAAFAEPRGSYVIELAELASVQDITSRFAGIAELIDAGITQDQPNLTLTSANKTTFDIPVRELSAAWRGSLDW